MIVAKIKVTKKKNKPGMIPLLILGLGFLVVATMIFLNLIKTSNSINSNVLPNHQSPSPTSWNKYTDPSFPISFDIPSNSSIEKRSQSSLKNTFGNELEETTFWVDKNIRSTRFYWIAVYPSQNETSVESWVRKYQAGGTDVILSNTTLGGIPAIHVTNMPGGIYDREGVYVMKGNYVYSLVLSASVINKTVRDEYNQILSTFKFTQ